MTELLPLAASSCAPSGVGGWIGTIIFGAVIGVLARLVLPGRQSISMVVTVVLGILGALIGYWLSAQIGVCTTSGIDWLRWIISIIVAAVLVVIYERVMAGRGHRV
ncbi:MAG: GlsB/YeaQ/YmgE family stress response membrane protein [Micrococcales bacterium]|uniref:GlsB/YeaQ/YmgE family stress response membrane protein n=1 Tax=Phycicoccus sp. TaxID=1902410 RepID=UPI0019BB14B7|nr:GlsB/YeaQ/YmgE family stress response membrane protein [Phycicoccus sp.]MBD3784192.1 GlsB/YeaQ/YmgE family stress response membrane protein [Micrococcales bacterium]HMM94175.1 GlsB/YeaQ/YmgE family stress response membrane protein [Phycicoccus sp.]